MVAEIEEYLGTTTECKHENAEKIVEAPTCTEEGFERVTCKDCKNSWTVSIPALGHSFVNGVCGSCGATEGSAEDITELITVYEKMMIDAWTERYEKFASEYMSVFKMYEMQYKMLLENLRSATAADVVEKTYSEFEQMLTKIDEALGKTDEPDVPVEPDDPEVPAKELYTFNDILTDTLHANIVFRDDYVAEGIFTTYAADGTSIDEEFSVNWGLTSDACVQILVNGSIYKFAICEDGSLKLESIQEAPETDAVQDKINSVVAEMNKTWREYSTNEGFTSSEVYVEYKDRFFKLQEQIQVAKSLEEIDKIYAEVESLVKEIDEYLASDASCKHADRTALETVDASCTEDGYTRFFCPDCQKEWYESIAAIGHSFIGGKCEHCGAMEETAEDITELRNNAQRQIVTTWNTYLNNNDLKSLEKYESYYKTYEELVSRVTLAESADEITEAQKEFDRLIEQIDNDLKSSISCNHESVTLIESVQSTCTTVGYETYVCDTCGEMWTKDLGFGDHVYDDRGCCTSCDSCLHLNYETVKSVDATCTEEGYKLYRCTVCHNEWTENTDVTGHNYENGACTVCKQAQPKTLYVYTASGEFGSITLTYEFYDDQTVYGHAEKYDETGNVVSTQKAWANWDRDGEYIRLIFEGEVEDTFGVSEDGVTLYRVEKETVELRYSYRATTADGKVTYFEFYSDYTAKVTVYTYQADGNMEVTSEYETTWRTGKSDSEIYIHVDGMELGFTADAAGILTPMDTDTDVDQPDQPVLPDPGEGDGETTLPEVDYDFGGKTVTVYVPALSTTNWDMLVGDDLSNVINASLYERHAYTEEKLNVSLEFVSCDAATLMNQLTVLIQSGECDASFVSYNGTQVMKGVANGMFADLRGENILQLDSAWWNDDYNAAAGLLGKQYTAVGDIGLSVYDMISVIYFNQEMLENYGLDNPYELVFDGTWTFEKLREYTEMVYSDMNGDGSVDVTDSLGLIGATTPDTPRAFLYATPCSFVEYDESDGSISITCEERLIDVMERAVDLWNTQGAYRDSIENVYTTMSGGNALMMIDYLNRNHGGLRQNYLDETVEYGILPLPKMDEEQESYTASVGGGHNVIAVVGNTASDMVCAVLDTMGKYSHDKVLPVYQQQLLKGGADSEMAQKSLEIAMGSAHWDFLAAYDSLLGGAVNALWVNPFNQDGTTMMSNFQMNREVVKQKLNELLSLLYS